MSKAEFAWRTAPIFMFALMALVPCGAARADDAPPPPADQPAPPPGASDAPQTDDAPRQKVEKIVVTAPRRSVDIQKSSISATVLSEQDLKDKNVNGLTALQYAAPSVTIDQNGGANVFNIRGIGRERVDVEIPSGVVIYRDGVPTLTGFFQNEPYYDMVGIEVLRGPQGTVAGKSASGGAVFIRTRNPDLDDVNGFVQSGFGNHGQFEATGAINVPLSDTFAVRVAYNHFQRDSWYNLTGPYTGDPDKKDLDSARISLLWQPTDDLQIVWKNDFSYLDFGGDVASSYQTPLFDVHQDAPFYNMDKSWRSVLDVKYTFDSGMTFRSLTGVQSVFTRFAGDLNGAIEAPTNWFRAQGNFHFYSQEFSLVSPDDQAFRWVAGAFAQRQLNLIPSFTDTGKFGFTFTGGGFLLDFPYLMTPWRQVEDDLAAFGNIEYDLSPTVTLEAGTRFSYNIRTQHTEVLFGFGDAPPSINIFGQTPSQMDRGVVGVYGDYKIGLNWKPTDIDFLYVQHSLGHNTKAVNLLPPNDRYGRMEVFDYEAGWKTSAFDDRMRIQLDAYYESIANYQASFGLEVAGAPTGVDLTRNAFGRSVIYGLEASAQASFGNWGLDFGAAYLHSKLGNFPDVQNPFIGFVTAPGVSIPSDCDTTTPFLDIDGAKAPFSPSFTGNVGVQYDIDAGGGWIITPRADYAHRSSARAALYKCSIVDLDSRDLVNLQLKFSSQNGWYGSAWMTNATDQEYIAGIQNNGTLFTAGPPMLYGLRVGKTF